MIGPCNTKKPGLFDIVGQAKWNAWNQLGDLSQVIILCISLFITLHPDLTITYSVFITLM